MEYMLKTTFFSGQESFIKNKGDMIWDVLCEYFHTDAHFTRMDVASVLVWELKYAPRTAQSIAYAIVANLLAMPEGGLFPVNKRLVRFHNQEGL